MSERLREAIRTRGRVSGELVLVDTFLNHKVDVELMTEIGAWLAARFEPVDAVVTSEASGIAPAFTTAMALGVPVVYAKKRHEPRAGVLSRQVESPTKGDRPWLELAPHILDGIHTALIVDDFLAGGRTALALAEMLEEAGVHIVGLGFAVERAWAGGRDRLEQAGFRVVAAATVMDVRDGRPVLA